jgi:predicted transglutaminase-like cysteine proteinase
MARRSSLALLAAFATTLSGVDAGAGGVSVPRASIVEAGPTLAPLQHVRFCLHYPDECRSNSPDNERLDLTPASLTLLKRVNHRINASIIPISKTYIGNLNEIWTIAPIQGDCNDYAVTKRHELLKKGFPSSALRLSVTKTTFGVGHLVLVVSTKQGDLVMDSLSDAIRSWQATNYQWLKIQSARDPHLWVEVGSPVVLPSPFLSADKF